MMTIEQVRDRCKVWQQRLRLADWKITVEYVRDKDLPDCWGSVERWNLDNRTAVIHLVELGTFSMVDYPYGTFDLEDTLVHELLHLYTEGILGRGQGTRIDRESAENHFAEQMCDAVAEALVALDRAQFGTETVAEKPELGIFDMLVPVQGNGIR